MSQPIKILFFTGNRSEFGLATPILNRIKKENDMEYRLIVSGTHLSEEYGFTIQEILAEGVEVHHRIDIGVKGKSNLDVLQEMARLLDQVGSIIQDECPDYFFVLGDRYESFAAALAAFYLNIPVVHRGGGYITQGGCSDDVVRHLITKLAVLHFVTSEAEKEILGKLGEEDWRIFVNGYPLGETLREEELYSKAEMAELLGLDFSRPVLVFTQHPISAQEDMAMEQVRESLIALGELGYQTVITYPNSDAGGANIIEEYSRWAETPNFIFYRNLGKKKYLSVMKYCSVVVGNSSSGLLETPFFKVPAVNIGKRQEGRIRSNNVIDVDYDRQQIEQAIEKAIFDQQFRDTLRHDCSSFDNSEFSDLIIDNLRRYHNCPGLLNKRIK